MLHKTTPATEYAAAFKLNVSQTSAPGQIIYSFKKIYILIFIITRGKLP